MAVISSSTSSQSSASSTGTTEGFICTLCFKHFPTGQALGGHQNAHLYERSLKPTPNILASVLNHPLPPDSDDEDDDADYKFVTNEEVQKEKVITFSSASSSAVNGGPPPPEFAEPIAEELGPEPDLTDAQEAIVRSWLTPNLFGCLEPMGIRDNGPSGFGGSGRHGLSSTENDDDSINTELTLKIAPVVVDLELKLGF